LMRLDPSEIWQALVTPPANSRAGRGSGDAEFHVRPRASLLATATVAEAERLRGGLAPVVARRVCEYIDSHLDEDLRLETLAKTARLSVSHFARSFRDTVGLPPHHYVLQRRIDRAREMLIGTETPLWEIAVTIGFADQSHFARHFHRLVGI